MPYILSPQINEGLPGLWLEGHAYKKQNLYSIIPNKLPPVNYDAHTIFAHSVTHIESPRHTQESGKTVDQYFSTPHFFYGNCTVVRLRGNGYKLIDPQKGIYHWEVSADELKASLNNRVPNKLLLTSDSYPKDENSFHDPNFVLTLSLEAANWLTSSTDFNLYGTSWKSSDYKPGSAERPIHNKLFEKCIILECLELSSVPEGEYFLVTFPLYIKGASESPVTPILFTYDELTNNR